MSAARRRAVAVALVGILVAVVCGLLGRWQWNRHVVRDAKIALVQANYSADPVPMADLLDGPTTSLDPADEWRPVTLTGTYAADSTVLLRNRPVDGTPAYHVLVPLVLADGDVLVVDRGWVPMGADGSSDVAVAAPPSGTVQVTVRLRVPEPASTRSAPAGQVQAADPGQVLAAGSLDAPAYAAIGGLVDESPAPAQALGTLPLPDTDPGSHLSYAFQWWVFALGALGAFGWAARREVLDAREPDLVDRSAEPAAPRPLGARSQPRRRGRDEVDEDALLDAAEAATTPPGAEPRPGTDPAHASEIRSR